MKSKSTIILLSIAVVVLWGIIAYKFFIAIPDSSAVVPMQAKPSSKVIPETDTLLLNYKDPFLGNIVPLKKSIVTSNKIIVPAQKIASSPKEKVTIRYIGIIRANKGTKHIVNINGSTHTVSKGDETGGFRLTTITDDSLFFTKNNHTYSIATLKK